MQRTMIFLSLLAGSTGCTAMTEQNKTTVRRIYEEAINEAKPALLDELIAADFTGEKGDKGPPAYRANVEALSRAFSDLHFVVEDLVAEDDRVVVRWSWTGKHTAPFRGFAASDHSVKNTGIALYRLRDAKVVSVHLEADRLGVLQQIDVIPADLTKLQAVTRLP